MEIGDTYQFTFSYTDENVEAALEQISEFDADMGGTEILMPLSVSIDTLAEHAKETRVFLLTDGQVDNREKVIAYALTGRDNIKIHTFGIGSGCDSGMVLQVATNGRGSCSLVGDKDENLKGLVVTALARASEPSLQGCSLQFVDLEDLGEIFRDQLITRGKIISKQSFEDLKLRF